MQTNALTFDCVFNLVLNEHDSLKASLRMLASALEEEQKKNTNLRNLFEKIFPLELYKCIRPDVLKAMNFEDDKIIEHYVNHGCQEIDLNSYIKINNQKYLSNAAKNAAAYFRDVADNRQIGGDNERQLRFSKTLGSTQSMEQNNAHRFAQKRTIMHIKSKTICTWIPKIACSNLRYSIALDNGIISSDNDIKWIHNNNNSIYPSNSELLQAQYSFVILRNPFKRLLSYFLDKICHNSSNAGNDGSYRQARDIFNMSSEDTFEKFVSKIWENPELVGIDEHTLPQCNFLIYTKYHDYFQFERFSELQESLEKKIGLKIVDVRDFNSIHTCKGFESSASLNARTTIEELNHKLKEGIKPKALNMFTNEMITRIGTVYFNDILLYLQNFKHSQEELDIWIHRMLDGEQS